MSFIPVKARSSSEFSKRHRAFLEGVKNPGRTSGSKMGNATEDRNSGKYWRVDKKQHSNGSGEISNDHYGG